MKRASHLEITATSVQTKFTLMIGTQPYPTPLHAAGSNRLVTEQYEPAIADFITH